MLVEFSCEELHVIYRACAELRAKEMPAWRGESDALPFDLWQDAIRRIRAADAIVNKLTGVLARSAAVQTEPIRETPK